MTYTSLRRKTVRIEIKSENIVDFVRFNSDLSTQDMAALESALKEAQAYQAEHKIGYALKIFQRVTGKSGMVCPAPYLYDITLD